MCHLESVQELISEKLIRTKGLWGPVHELGRNQQRQEWEFPPHTTEATCNLWCVYVHETVLGIPRGRANIALWPPVREKRVRIYLGKGPNVKNWNAWTALETYLQVLGQRGGGVLAEAPLQGTLGRQYHSDRRSPLTNLQLTQGCGRLWQSPGVKVLVDDNPRHPFSAPESGRNCISPTIHPGILKGFESR